ncbi:CYTH domain-containing protein [Microbacterium sp.]|uniref:CYTH domain-containing protein n=1 Tax=Microbacterium sp. TaxID=51671 RepID=UPI0039E45302
MPEPAAAGAARSREIELSYDVDEDTAPPDWTALPGVVSVGAGERRDLDARYLDTADHAFGRAGYAFRRRTGGPDEGWHIKGPKGADGGRTELHWPLGTGDDPPAEALAVVRGVTDAALADVARIRVTRVAYALRDADGGLVAEFADDRVACVDLRRGVEQSWREWELELGPAAPADHADFFARAAALVHTAGGRPAVWASKLVRTLTGP